MYTINNNKEGKKKERFVPKLVNITTEMADLLDNEKNSSQLIRDLLYKHYKNKGEVGKEELKPEEIDEIQEALVSEMKEVQAKINALHNQKENIKQKEVEEVSNIEFENKLAAWEKEHQELNQRWYTNKITEDEYWEQVDLMKARKPVKE